MNKLILESLAWIMSNMINTVVLSNGQMKERAELIGRINDELNPIEKIVVLDGTVFNIDDETNEVKKDE